MCIMKLVLAVALVSCVLGAAPTPCINDSSVLAYWNAATAGVQDGNVWRDLTGRYPASPIGARLHNGKALFHDGAVVSTPLHLGSLGDTWTISAYIRFETQPATLGNAPVTTGCFLGASDPILFKAYILSNGRLTFQDGSFIISQSSSVSFHDNQLHSVTLVRRPIAGVNPWQTELYIDGLHEYAEVHNRAFSFEKPQSSLILGAADLEGTNGWTGEINSVLVLQTDASAVQVMAIHDDMVADKLHCSATPTESQSVELQLSEITTRLDSIDANFDSNFVCQAASSTSGVQRWCQLRKM